MYIDKRKINYQRALHCVSSADMRNAGVTQGNMNSIWNHKSMRPETVGKIARALKCDVLDIIENPEEYMEEGR